MNELDVRVDFEELASCYYRILSDMVTREVSAKIKESVKQFECLVEKVEFHKCLIGVAFEWIRSEEKAGERPTEEHESIDAESQEFPWILNELDITPFKFYKIIEPVLRATECSMKSIKFETPVY